MRVTAVCVPFAYQVGKTKVFFRQIAYDRAEELRLQMQRISAVMIQSSVRRHQARGRYLATRAHVIKSQAQSRVWLARQLVMRMRRYNAAVAFQ